MSEIHRYAMFSDGAPAFVRTAPAHPCARCISASLHRSVIYIKGSCAVLMRVCGFFLSEIHRYAMVSDGAPAFVRTAPAHPCARCISASLNSRHLYKGGCAVLKKMCGFFMSEIHR
jgi:hypothetical protein